MYRMIRFALGLGKAPCQDVAHWPRWVLHLRALMTERKPGYTFWEW